MDQASNQPGFSLWFDDNLMATVALTVPDPKWTYARRVQYLATELSIWLCKQLGPRARISTVLFEGVRSRQVLVTVGAFLTCTQIDAHLFKHSFIESSQWKSYAKRRGATAPFIKIKGRKALEEIGWTKEMPATDDEADSILMYLTWMELRKTA